MSKRYSLSGRRATTRRLGWRYVILAGTALAGVCILLGGLRIGFSSRSVLLLSIAGFFIGAVQVPVWSPDSFHSPHAWQASLGTLGGATFASAFGAPFELIVLGAAVGFLLSLLGAHLLRILDFF